MFYESIGAQLGAAADLLAEAPPDRGLDERARRERRQITRLFRRVGRIWPDLFLALEEESRILDETRSAACEAARAHGLLTNDRPPLSANLRDPLARYRQLLCEVDALVILLHTQGSEAWIQESLRVLRSGLAEAAEVQGKLVDKMLAD
jgi:hypothetical protein